MKPIQIFGAVTFSLMTATAVAGDRSLIASRGTFEIGTAKLITPQIRQSLGLALTEMAFGNQKRARAHADSVSAPSNLKVFVSTNGIGSARAKQVKEWAGECMDYWNATMESTTFSETNDPSTADVFMTIQNQVNMNGTKVAGLAEWNRSSSGNGLNLSARIQISSKDYFGSNLSEAQLKKAITHELGHILGLNDDCSSNLMSKIGAYGGEADDSEIFALVALDNRAKAIAEIPIASETRRNIPRVFEFPR